MESASGLIFYVKGTDSDEEKEYHTRTETPHSPAAEAQPRAAVPCEETAPKHFSVASAEIAPFEEIPRRERYICRRDKVGVIYDKTAMAEVSKMLGHNRIDVIAYSYL